MLCSGLGRFDLGQEVTLGRPCTRPITTAAQHEGDADGHHGTGERVGGVVPGVSQPGRREGCQLAGCPIGDGQPNGPAPAGRTVTRVAVTVSPLRVPCTATRAPVTTAFDEVLVAPL